MQMSYHYTRGAGALIRLGRLFNAGFDTETPAGQSNTAAPPGYNNHSR
jgi:hypothetical protein